MKKRSAENLVAVVIPIYQSELSSSEMLSLRQCIKVLGAYPIKIIKPESLNLSKLISDHPSIELLSFEDHYFTGTDQYNKLTTSLNFYSRFDSFEFMLIYQLDAFVFRNEIEKWCRSGFDYIGAPTLHQTDFDCISAENSEEYASALSDRRFVLNGGLSLRRIAAFKKYLRIYNLFYPAWKGNEDMLFSQEATRLLPMKMFMKTPSWQQAMNFSFEKSPAASYELTGGKLPFGCHAWERYDPAFWKPFIDQTSKDL